MLIVFQFPIADLRLFSNSYNERLNIPSWPKPVNRQYLKKAGQIEVRPFGGIQNWIGESRICNVKRAIRFPNQMRVVTFKNGITFSPTFRRFFFDGNITAKFEIGFSVNLQNNNNIIEKKDLSELIDKLMTIPVRIPVDNSSMDERPLINSGKQLAQFYSANSTMNGSEDDIKKSKLVKHQSPLIYISSVAVEKVLVPYKGSETIHLEHIGTFFANFLPKPYDNVRFWHMHQNSAIYDEKARELRVSLLRLNACREVFETVLIGIKTKLFTMAPKSVEADNLDDYLTNRVPNYLGVKSPKKFHSSEILKLAYQTMENNPYEDIDTIIEELKDILRSQNVKKFSKTIEKIEKFREEQSSEDKNDNNEKGEMLNKTKILFLGANPSDTSHLSLAKEVKTINDNIRSAGMRDNLTLVQEWAITTKSLMQVIVEKSPNIVHFSGHGMSEGIILEDDIGEAKIVTSEALASLFKLYKDSIKCVVLNSCYSHNQAEVIREHIPCVIGMKSDISDEASIAFSTGFYMAIGSGKDYASAYKHGISMIKLEGIPDDHIPILL